MKYLDLAIANETIKTIGIERKNKNGEVIVNDYAEVNQRIKAFRMVYPDGIIDTQMLSNENGVCTFKAMVGYYEDDINGCVRWLGTGHAQEKEDSNFINKTSYIENCETSAVGRALGMAGFGVDVSVASAEEVQNAMLNQLPTQEEADNYKLTFGKYKDQTLKEVYKKDEGYIQWLLNNSNDERFIKIIQMATGIEIPSAEESDIRIKTLAEINDLILDTDTDIEDIHKHYKINSLNQLSINQLQGVKEALQIKLNKKESE